MLLFVGLGNPGARYAGNRHNIGFMAAEAIAKRHDFGSFRRKFEGVAAEGSIADTRVTLLMPGTFMNESGRAVAEAARLYKIAPADIVVFHDELELPPGKLRVKTGGGNAGHNGLRSISGLISNDYKRVRLGIGHPGQKHLVESYVLQDFQKSEWPWVETLCDVVADNVTLLAEGKDSTFQNKVHLAMTAKGFGDPEPSGSK
jgi:PTH1 family peptidyl-tRNA hydrolase